MFPIRRSNPELFEHKIELKDETVPLPRRKTYQFDPLQLAELKKQLVELLESNCIRVLNSPYGAPIFFAKKKYGRLHMCTDYRALNKNTVIDSYPLPRINELLTQLKGARFLSRLDLRGGYHQLPIKKKDVHKTAYTYRYSTFEYLVMQFGLRSAPSTFQCIMNQILFNLLDKGMIVYLDDILIFAKYQAEYDALVGQVFDRLIKAQ